jgi:hypothetical protein
MNKKNIGRIWGIKSLKINGSTIHTICIRINSSPIILKKVINDTFWRNNHTISLNDRVSKIEFMHTTMNLDEAIAASRSLCDILFAHKIQKVYKESFQSLSKKNEITKDVISEMNKIHQEETALPFNEDIF